MSKKPESHSAHAQGGATVVRNELRSGLHPLGSLYTHAIESNIPAATQINLESYRARVREKFSLQAPEEKALAASDEQLNSLEKVLTQSNALLRSELSSLSSALENARANQRVEAASKNNLKQKLASLMAHLPIGVIELCPNGFVVDANPAAVSILESPLIGLRWSDVLKAAFRPQPDDGFEVSLVNGRRVQVQTQSMDSRSGQIILLNDQTQTRQLQNAVARNERMAALGKTAATLAHQVRTPLCGALLYLSQVLHDAELPPVFVERLQRAKGRLEHLERQVQQILMLSRGDIVLSQRLSPLALCDGITQACAPLKDSFRDLFIVHSDQDQAVLLSCNAEALIGAVINLVENAIQACFDGGKVEVCLQLGGVEQPDQPRSFELVVRDTGVGMSKETQARIFEPFFTSRDEGTGLGLSVVKLVVDAHGGALTIDSKTGQGTTVTIALPTV